MIIKKISCTQFAGIRDREIVLKPGLNTIYGKNESGKSTMVNLLAAILFQPTKLNVQKNRAFYDSFFPNAARGVRVTGDFVDGKVAFETNNGDFVLSKDWGPDARCTLSTPTGVIRNEGLINDTLATILQYGKGVYTGMLFSSQRNTDDTLRTILEAAQGDGVKKDLSNAVTVAFSESEGVSVESIEQAILQRIADIEGKHWDRAMNRPKKKPERWLTCLGDILKAYYAAEDANAVLTELELLEQQAAQAAEDYELADGLAQAAEAAFKKFQNIYGKLETKAAQEQLARKLADEIEHHQTILQKWPELKNTTSKVRALLNEKAVEDKSNRYKLAVSVKKDIAKYSAALADNPCPTEEEIKAAETAEQAIAKLENKLSGMNIEASITIASGGEMEIYSLATGAALDPNAPITEAVVISVPGVFDLTLAPANVDVAMVGDTLKKHRDSLKSVLDKYKAVSVTDLSKFRKVALDIQARLADSENELERVLDGADLLDLVPAFQEREGVGRDTEAILAEIGSFVPMVSDADKFVAANEAIIEGYAAEYGSIEKLDADTEKLKSELKSVDAALAALDGIPPEYANMGNPALHMAMLDNDYREKQRTREEAAQAKAVAQTKLEARKAQMREDPIAARDLAQQNFKNQQELLEKWDHILRVFQEQKEALNDHPMQDVADKFSTNLKAITNGFVDSEFENPDAMEMTVYSQERQVGYNTMSEGTKETVSLAFRLAVLDHLFPNGGGVIIFDDPLSNMDTDRVAASCKLLREAAQRHQIIFLTCREEYLSMLSGHKIQFS